MDNSTQQNKQQHNGDKILLQTCNYLQKVIFNRPNALNSIDYDMFKRLNELIDEWSQDINSIKCILFKGSGEKAFSTGGDLKMYYSFLQQKNFKSLEEMCRYEYTYQYKISKVKQIKLSFLNGYTMGGCVGTVFASEIRIATEKSIFSMPETKIGYFADASSPYYLNKIDKSIAMFLGLTGERLVGEELVQIGIANYFVKSDRLNQLEDELVQLFNEDQNLSINDVEKLIQEKYAIKIESKYKFSEYIYKIFNTETLEELIKNITECQNDQFKQLVQNNMASGSPLSQMITFQMFKLARNIDLRNNMIYEFRISQRLMAFKDFSEGIRTALVDKKDKPQWSFVSLKDVPNQFVQDHFKPLTDIKDLQI